MESRTIQVVRFLATVAVSQAIISPFLAPPKHDGVKRVCELTSENFTTVVRAAEMILVVFEDPSPDTTPKSPCQSELLSVAEITAQMLHKKNITVCRAPASIVDIPIKTGTTAPQFESGDVYIYKRGKRKPYYGLRSPSDVVGFVLKANSTRVSVIAGRLEMIAFEGIQDPKVVGFFMQGAADYLVFEEVASNLSPSLLFYAVFDREVAKYLRLNTVGQINLYKAFSKTPVPCPQNPATVAQMEDFITSSARVLFTKLDNNNLYHPQFLDPNRILVLFIGDYRSPGGGYVFHLVTKLVQNNANNIEFEQLNFVWIEPHMFPTIYLIKDELEETLGIPKQLPAFGAINVTTLQNSWFNISSLDASRGKTNLVILQEFLNGVMDKDIPVELALSSSTDKVEL